MHLEKRYSIFFRVNKTNIDLNYLENGHVISTMIDDIQATLDTVGFAPDSLLIYASASPEGSLALNERLARGRALSAKNYILKALPQLNQAHIKIESRPNDWSGVLQTARANDSLPYRDQILKILTDPRIVNKEAALRAKPEVFRYIRDNMLHKMRTATVTIRVIGKIDEFAVKEEISLPELHMDIPEQFCHKLSPDSPLRFEPAQPVIEPAEKKPFYLAVKTNMLYDLALVPNIGVDIYLGKNFSLAANWMYSWWKNDNIHWYWRTYGGDLGVRYWFGKAANEKPLTGHHIGLYGQIVTYDFELGGRGYLGDRWTYGGGIEYGYSLPIGKRLNIDFNLGVGYLGGEFKEYLPIDGHYVWQATKRRQFIGPTKAEISLVWQLGRGNINAEKGGKR